jgi:hypothetical protein
MAVASWTEADGLTAVGSCKESVNTGRMRTARGSWSYLTESTDSTAGVACGSTEKRRGSAKRGEKKAGVDETHSKFGPRQYRYPSQLASSPPQVSVKPPLRKPTTKGRKGEERRSVFRADDLRELYAPAEVFDTWSAVAIGVGGAAIAWNDSQERSASIHSREN